MSEWSREKATYKWSENCQSGIGEGELWMENGEWTMENCEASSSA